MQKKAGKKIIITVIAAVIITIAVWLAYTAGRNQGGKDSGGIVIADETTEWNRELEDRSEGQTGIKIPGYGEVTVEQGSDTWDITLANPKDNDCYFQYTITIGGSETPIYESDWIEPGRAITSFDVSETLEEGTYEIHFNISACTMDHSHTPLNGADVKAVLNVI